MSRLQFRHTQKTKLKLERKNNPAPAEVYDALMEQVKAVNKTLQPFARITRLTVLDKPLEMTTTKKVKRSYKK